MWLLISAVSKTPFGVLSHGCSWLWRDLTRSSALFGRWRGWANEWSFHEELSSSVCKVSTFSVVFFFYLFSCHTFRPRCSLWNSCSIYITITLTEDQSLGLHLNVSVTDYFSFQRLLLMLRLYKKKKTPRSLLLNRGCDGWKSILWYV